MLDRILCGQHEKWRFQLVGLPGHGNLALLHGLQEGGLGLGRGPVDFVSQYNIGKYGAGAKLEFLSLRGIHDQVCADHIRRHQVRGELNAPEFQSQGVAQ